MKEEKGLWLAIDGAGLVDKIDYAITAHGQFSYPIPQGDFHPRRAELVLVSLGRRTADYLGISIRSRVGTTGQTNVMISNLIPLEKLLFKAVEAKLPARFRTGFQPPTQGGIYRPTPKLFEALLSIFLPPSAENNLQLNAITRALNEANAQSSRMGDAGLEAFERDAIGCALQAWAGPGARRRILRSAIPTSDDRAPFLERLKDVQSREDPQIAHDHNVFPGMTVSARDIISTVTLTEGPDRITILNCNRQPLEQTLGVDLIYYSHRFKSFVLVQYKRMVDENGISGYRPHLDSNHAKEIARMKTAEQLLNTVPAVPSNDTACYRLTTDPFFVKLCEAKAPIALDSGMVAGMYVPLRLWESLLTSKNVKGPKGGVSVTWENCNRRFTNGEFTNLLRYGWVGSSEAQTQTLSTIIEQVLSSARMLVFASTQPGNGSQDYRRDNWGRFASEDDDEGAF